mgnify:CR=1 FL=1
MRKEDYEQHSNMSHVKAWRIAQSLTTRWKITCTAHIKAHCNNSRVFTAWSLVLSWLYSNRNGNKRKAAFGLLVNGKNRTVNENFC